MTYKYYRTEGVFAYLPILHLAQKGILVFFPLPGPKGGRQKLNDYFGSESDRMNRRYPSQRHRFIR